MSSVHPTPPDPARRRRRSLVVALVAGCSSGRCEGRPSRPRTRRPSRSRRAKARSRASRPTKLVVGLGYIPSVQFAQFYLAQQNGYYADAGLDVEFQNKIDPDLITLVGQGTIDVGIGDGTSVIPAVSNGIPVAYVATIYGQFPNIVFAKASSGISDRGRPEGQEDRDRPAATARAGSCSRRCSSRPA